MYAYNARVNKNALSAVVEANAADTQGQILEVAELSFKEGCILALSSRGQVQVVSQTTLEVQSAIDLDCEYRHLRLVENPLSREVKLLLFGSERVACLDLESRSVERALEVGGEEGYESVESPFFCLSPGLSVCFAADRKQSGEREVVQVSLI